MSWLFFLCLFVCFFNFSLVLFQIWITTVIRASVSPWVVTLCSTVLRATLRPRYTKMSHLVSHSLSRLSFKYNALCALPSCSSFFVCVCLCVTGIKPDTHSPGMFSWFPILFPLKVSLTHLIQKTVSNNIISLLPVSWTWPNRFNSKYTLQIPLKGLVICFNRCFYFFATLRLVTWTDCHALITFNRLFCYQQPISVSREDEVTVRFWRCNNGKKVWYEWAVTEPSCSAIHNPAGRSYTIGL